jgi:phosphate transport system permease protein
MALETTALYRKRVRTNRLALVLSILAMVIGMGFLAWILAVLLYKGFGALSLTLFTASTPAPGSEGACQRDPRQRGDGRRGNLHCDAHRYPGGCLSFRVRAAWLACTDNPLHQRHPAVCSVHRHRRFHLRCLCGAGAALFGLGGFLALALIAIPVVVRTTENMLNLVPASLREAASALGAPRWKVVLSVVLRAAKAGVLTGILLAIARVSGETAPLLFTALNNQFMSLDLNGPMANLPVVIFQYAMSPYENWNSLAWGGAIIITFGVLCLNILVRTLFRKKI